MKSEWNIGTISEVCSLVTDGSHYSPKSCDSGEYMVSVKDFKGFGFDFSNCKHISSDDYEKMKASGCIPEHGDILIGKDGARFFEDIIIYNQPEKPALLSSIAILRCNPDIILPQFLYYICKNPIFKKDVRDNYGSGSAIPRIVLKDFKRMTISYPDLAEQRRIVASLVAIDDRIALNTAINENLEQQAQALFKAWFVDFEPFGGVMPDDWQDISVYDLADYINGAAFKKAEYGDSGLPIIKIAELKSGITDSTQYCCVRKDDKYYINDRDILFSWSGNPDTSIDTFLWSRGKAILNQHTFRVVSKYKAPAFTYFLLKYLKPQFAHIASNKQTTGLGHVTVADLKRLQFCSNIATINEFEVLATPIFNAIFAIYKENQHLAALRDTLLPKLMNGEIDVSAVKI